MRIVNVVITWFTTVITTKYVKCGICSKDIMNSVIYLKNDHNYIKKNYFTRLTTSDNLGLIINIYNIRCH